MNFNRKIYFVVLAYILLILATLGTGLWLIFSHTGTIIGGCLVGYGLFLIGRLTHRLNGLSRNIALFFDAIQDHDNTLHFPLHNVGKDQARLNESLNRINTLLARAQREQKKQEHFYRSLIEQVPSGVLAWDPSGQIVLANSTALTLLGCDGLSNRAQAERLLEEREHLSVSTSEMRIEGRPLTLVSIKDIGDELSDKQSDSWNELTHVLTHEIMNTIAPIVSLSQTLSTYEHGEGKTLRGLQIIEAQSTRLLEFTESFRHLSHLAEPQKKWFSLSDLLGNLGELLAADFAARGIRFSLHCTPASIEINGDQGQLSQVFLNLLNNAMQAIEADPQGTIELTAVRSDRVWIEVSDSGCGIAPELLKRVFVPFFSTKSQGSGIGLSLCRQIVRQHGGHLSVKESRPGKTVFCLDLPL